MRHQQLLLAICAAVIASTSQAQIYKCTVDGKSVFSDRPCAADSQPINSTPAAGGYNPAAGDAARQAHCDALIAEYHNAARWAGEFVHRDNVRREEAKMAHYKERAFMECGRVLD